MVDVQSAIQTAVKVLPSLFARVFPSSIQLEEVLTSTVVGDGWDVTLSFFIPNPAPRSEVRAFSDLLQPEAVRKVKVLTIGPDGEFKGMRDRLDV